MSGRWPAATAPTGELEIRDASIVSAARGPLTDATATKSHAGMVFFVTMSLLVTLSLRQEYNIAPGSAGYWLLMVPAAALPLLDSGPIAGVLLGRARLLLGLVLLAGAWHLLRGDGRAVLQLGLMVLVLAWASIARARISINDLARIYMLIVGVGIAVYLLTDINSWGVLPGTTRTARDVWRVSFFPNIASTGLLSLAVFVALTRDRDTMRCHPITLAVATYFLIFSFVRTAVVGCVLYIGLRWWYGRRRRITATSMFWIAIAAAIAVNLFIAFSPAVLASLQQSPSVSRVFLQNATNLTVDEIYDQLYRPWLWNEHVTLFLSSPGLMGLGSFDFSVMHPTVFNEGHEYSGSESLPTRLLAMYGISGVLFLAYLIQCLRRSALAHDRWACACFAVVVLLMMNWGSVFHPTSALYLVFLLMITQGSGGFPASPHAREQVG